MKWPGGHALILAAGRGTRLLPLTTFVPKPLFYIISTPALELVVQKLSVPEIETIAINAFHLKGQILDWFHGARLKKDVRILEEEMLLGTGGAVKNAFEHMGYDRPLLVYNADIISNLDPVKLLRKYFALGQPASLLCIHNRAPFNKLEIRGDDILSFNAPGPDALAYTGISVVSPGLFRNVPLVPCSLVEIWKDAIRDKKPLKALRAETILAGSSQGWIWEDIGTPCGYLQGNGKILKNRHGRETWVSPSAVTGHGLKLQGMVIIGERARIGPGAFIRDSIIWPDTEVESNAYIENSIVTPHAVLSCRM